MQGKPYHEGQDSFQWDFKKASIKGQEFCYKYLKERESGLLAFQNLLSLKD